MTGKERRYEILKLIKSVKEPISGTELAKKIQCKPPGNCSGYSSSSSREL